MPPPGAAGGAGVWETLAFGTSGIAGIPGNLGVWSLGDAASGKPVRRGSVYTKHALIEGCFVSLRP